MYDTDEVNPELARLWSAMDDGAIEVWLNLPAQTIRTYVQQRLVEELEEVKRMIEKPDSNPLRIVDQKILQIVGINV